jgi:CDP-diacylglycerol--glycerol-3-phosphate 3-phosphatidyltransferase
MNYPNRRLIPQTWQDAFIKMLSPLIGILARRGYSPNSFTVAGLIVTLFAAAVIVPGYVRLAGILILLGGFCDTVDGLIARSTGRASRFGALLDSSVDRYSDFVMYLGVAAYFIRLEDYGTSIFVFLALSGSFMVSYTRARAESLGYDAKIGFMQRPERIVLIGLGALIHIAVLQFVICAIAFLANLTALQRIRYAFKQDSFELEEDIVLGP